MSEALQEQVKTLEEELVKLKALQREGTEPEAEPEERKGQEGSDGKKGKKRSQGRVFNFSAHPKRHVALRLAYLGWGYQGFAVQENTDNTVEARLFEALLKTRLVEDRTTSNYHRCGRTDKGVSAFSQVISIDLRSTQLGGGLGVTLPAQAAGTGNPAGGTEPSGGAELPYAKMLNRVLPPDIRVLDWAPVESGFSARFDCRSRTYRYYFPRGDLDVQLMGEAAKRYEGTHDFRNICKMDVGNGVLQFQRTIESASIMPAQPHESNSPDPYDLFVFEIKGLAFLYHQVRCMMAILLLIGQKLEAPELIDQLLDVQSNPRKPQYSMAVDYPLVLHDCHFEGLRWHSEPEEVRQVLATLQNHWTQAAIRTRVLHGMIQGLQTSDPSGESHSLPCWLLEGSKQRNYRPLLDRPRCESLESRIEHFTKRGRLEREEGENGEGPVHRGKRSKHRPEPSSSPSPSSSSGPTSQGLDLI